MNKTIDINPSLFTIGGSKTRKNKEKKQIPSVKPLISPNLLKNKFLRRIKEHKLRETENLENNKKKLTEPTTQKKTTLEDINEFSNEFNQSLTYLQTLSKQKKINDEKEIYEKNKQKKREELERKTLKNYNYNEINTPHVNIELPDELVQPLINIDTTRFNVNVEQPMKLSYYKSDSNIPYGILKGGIKPTYRTWTKTQRNNIVTNPDASLIIQQKKPTTERENRLNMLKEKLKQKQMQQVSQNESNQMSIPMSIQNTNTEDIMTTQYLIQKPEIPKLPSTETTQNQPINNIINQQEPQINKTKRFIKKTIKRKYTLGKSKIKKTVGILLKDRNTRKLILSAHKDLKRKNINDVKLYLRDHNLIKIGSNAPNDVIRKLYETSMLAGEITNSNTDILLHNLIKDDTKEI